MPIRVNGRHSAPEVDAGEADGPTIAADLRLVAKGGAGRDLLKGAAAQRTALAINDHSGASCGWRNFGLLAPRRPRDHHGARVASTCSDPPQPFHPDDRDLAPDMMMIDEPAINATAPFPVSAPAKAGHCRAAPSTTGIVR